MRSVTWAWSVAKIVLSVEMRVTCKNVWITKHNKISIVRFIGSVVNVRG